ncbi:hypothetical protein ACOMHN_025523 [Nucella lapillus]
MPASYRSQGGSVSERSRVSGLTPGPGAGYGGAHQGQYMGSSLAANQQRYMMAQGRPPHMASMAAQGYSQQMPPSHSPLPFSSSLAGSQTSQLPSQQQQQQQQQMYHGQQQQPQPPGQPPALQPSPSPNPLQPHHSLPTSSSSSSSSSHRPPSSQGASPRQLSPAPPGMADQNSNHSTSSRKSEENTESNKENSVGEDVKGDSCGGDTNPSGGPQSMLGVAGLRLVPSPAGSTGSRSDTPASNSGTQAGSPMPPRPPSSHLEGQGHSTQPPMATQGYSQQMMPPPMGGQMGYPGTTTGGKMGAGPPMAASQMNPHYPQYPSQYPQGSLRGPAGVMGSMQGGPGGSGSGPVPGNGSYPPQAMYNGPGQMGPGASSMYNSMMNRSMPPGYTTSPYGPPATMPINSHFGSFNSHMGPAQGPGPGPGPGSGPNPAQSSSGSVAPPGGPSSMMGGQMNMSSMGQPAMGMQHGAPMMPGGKGAQAAAQAALMAAANSAGSRMPQRGMAGSPRMMGGQGAGSPSPVGTMTAMSANLGSPSLNSLSNQIQQITSSSVTVPSKPSSPATNIPTSTSHPAPPSSSAPPPGSFLDKTVSSSGMGVSGGEPTHLMSPMSSSDTQESSRPSSTATLGQTVDAANNTSDVPGSDGLGSMPNGDSTSVDSGFHSTADQSEKAPSESTPTHSSSPSNSNPPPSTNGQCEEGASQESNGGVKGIGGVAPSSSTIPTSVLSATTTTTTITSASLGTASAPSVTTTASSSEMLNSGSQTPASMPPLMMSSGTNCNNPPSIPNGPHYPAHHHPHPSMGYPMGPQGGMGGSHLMGGPGMHHQGMQQHSMGGMPPYNMPPGNMPPGSMPANSMAPGSMSSGNMPSNSMPPGSMGPGGISSNSMPPGSMGPGGMSSNSMPPSSMPPGSIGPGGMSSNSMPPGSMGPGGMSLNSMPPSSMPPGSMGPGGISSNSMPPGSMPPGSMPPGSIGPGGMSSNSMPPSNMPPGSMGPGGISSNSMPLSNMPPGSMGPGGMSSNSMPPSNMPPGSGMSPNMPPQGAMPNNMMNSMPPHGGMPGTMPMGGMPQSAGMPNSVPRGSMANHISAGSMPGTMGNSLGSNGKTNSMGSMTMPVHNNTTRASGPPDDPPEKKKKKASDMTKLYDLGAERDRRPFLDKLLAFLEEKRSPITTMPNISKQPLDLYKLYHCVREKGGFMEVNSAKRWKEICAIVNISCSASAAFTLKKNYLKYLFAFECKFDLGDVDPAPILAEMESHGDKKREKKRVPSPGMNMMKKKREKKGMPNTGSQSSQDAFQQAGGPNSQMMEGYPGGAGGMPPPFLQEGQMMGGQGMMMPNSMMPHPTMMAGPHHQGSAQPPMMGPGPNAMMMGSGPPAQNMMGGMGPQGGMINSAGSMMGPSGMMGPGMHMGSNSYGPGVAHGMMGQGSNSGMGPSPGPSMGGASGNAVSSSPGPLSSNSTNTAGTATSTTSSSIVLAPISAPNSRPPTADSVSVQDPFADEPGKSSSPATFQSRPVLSPTPGGFPSPGPPTTSATGFGSRPSSNSNPNAAAAFPNGVGSEGAPIAFRRAGEGFPARPDSAQYPYGQENSSHPSQQFRPQAATSDTTFTARFPGQQAAFRASGPGEAYGGSHPYSNHGSGMGPRMPGQEGYGAFSSQHPGIRQALARDSSFSPQAGSGSPLWDWNGAGSWGQALTPHPADLLTDYSLSGRDADRWSPMHPQRSFGGPTAPGAPSMAFGRPPLRASPQPRDKVLAAKLQQKSCGMLPSAQFHPRKEVVFPPDSVEATQPTLTKRRRLTHKDICPVEAWRLMMALKSGLLAESTWAIDTLNILLFDDATVTYFNLSSLPGLLEVLTEHFRAALLQVFTHLSPQELRAREEGAPPEGGESGSEEGDSAQLIHADSEACLDKSLYSADFTWVSRQGRGVVKDQSCDGSAVLDAKRWDKNCRFVSGRKHWQKGGGDITSHVVPCFESSQTRQFLTDMFHLNRTSSASRKRKAAGGGGGSGVCGNGGPKRSCSEQECPLEKVKREEGVISPDSDLCDHSKVCSQRVFRQNSDSFHPRIKQEPGEPSQDSLPPPLLSSHASEGATSNEDKVKVDVKENSEQSRPPQLTTEKEGVDTRTADSNPASDPSGGKEKDSEGASSSRTKDSDSGSSGPSGKKDSDSGSSGSSGKKDSDSASSGPSGKKDSDSASSGSSGKEEEDEMTAEIVAMMIREQDKGMEEEAYRPDECPLTTVQCHQEEMGRRCVALSNIFRSLSCIPGNEALLAKHHGLMWLLGQLLMLHHTHPLRPKAPPAPPLSSQQEGKGGVKVEDGVVKVEGSGLKVESVKEEEGEKDWAMFGEWWWETLEALRENALVVLANISSHMHMRDMANEVCLPILDGLLHWMVCPSSAACDPLPSASSSSQLSPQRLVLEALCKLCIHEENVDLVLATPPFSRILLLLERLIRLLAERSQPVPREFSIALLSRLVQGDTVAARAIALQHPSIPLLLEFLESAEQSAMAAASQQGAGVSGVQSNPEALGTSLDMLRRAASTLLHMARLPHNRKLFVNHQSRLLALVMSQWLDPGVTQIVSDVLFECSQYDPLPT